MFCDIHGHSKKKGLFIFGCNNNMSKKDIMKERIFSLMFHKNCEDFFYDNCTFDIQPNKTSTGRVAVRTEFGILHSYTLECSVSGPARGRLKGYHFTISALKQLGHDFCKTLLEHSTNSAKYDEALKELSQMYPTIGHLEMADSDKHQLEINN